MFSENEYITSIRLIPMNKDLEFNGQDFRTVQWKYFVEELYYRLECQFQYRSPIKAEEDALLLFQYDSKVIALAKLKQVKPYNLQVGDYAGVYELKKDSIAIIGEPITEDEIKTIWPNFKGFGRVKAKLDCGKWDEFFELIIQKNIMFAKDIPLFDIESIPYNSCNLSKKFININSSLPVTYDQAQFIMDHMDENLFESFSDIPIYLVDEELMDSISKGKRHMLIDDEAEIEKLYSSIENIINTAVEDKSEVCDAIVNDLWGKIQSNQIAIYRKLKAYGVFFGCFHGLELSKYEEFTSNNEPVIFICPERINIAAEKVRNECNKNDDIYKTLLTLVTYHELAHAFMHVSILEEPSFYEIIEESMANALAYKYINDKQHAAEYFIENQPLEYRQYKTFTNQEYEFAILWKMYKKYQYDLTFSNHLNEYINESIAKKYSCMISDLIGVTNRVSISKGLSPKTIWGVLGAFMLRN